MIYVVMSSGDNDRCCLSGVFAKKKDALISYNDVKKNWKDWSKGCEREITEFTENDGTKHFCLTNYDSDEGPLEVVLKPQEIK